MEYYIWKYPNLKKNSKVINKCKSILWFSSICFVFLASNQIHHQKEECIFDDKAITEDFLRDKKAVKAYTWSDANKTAAVLMQTGEYVFIKKWACISYGMEAKKVTMFPAQNQEDMAYWQEDVLNFGQQFLEAGDFKVYKSVIEKKEWINSAKKLAINTKYTINIPHDTYPEFFVLLERRNDMVIITLYYYMN